MDKIEDFGVHASAYYPLKVEIFKTRLDEQLLDLLWNKYWVATLSQSLIVSASPNLHLHLVLVADERMKNRPYATSQVNDLASKLSSASMSLGNSTSGLKVKHALPSGQATGKGKKAAKQQGEYEGVEEEETPLSKVAKDR